MNFDNEIVSKILVYRIKSRLLIFEEDDPQFLSFNGDIYAYIDSAQNRCF